MPDQRERGDVTIEYHEVRGMGTAVRYKERQDKERATACRKWRRSGLVFTTRDGGPIEPRNLVRSFVALCDRAGSGGSASTTCGTRARPCSTPRASNPAPFR